MERALFAVGGKPAGAKKDKDKTKKKNKKPKSGERDGAETSNEKTENVAKTKTEKMLELELDPEVIETSLSEPPVRITEKRRKSGSKPGSPITMKPILLNRDEKSNVHKSEKAAELPHDREHKDEIALKRDREGKKAEKRNKLATAAINGFHSESMDSTDDIPVVVNRSHPDQVKASSNESKSRKSRQELDLSSGDGDASNVANAAAEAKFTGDRQSKRKPVSNDVTVSGKDY